MEKQKCSCEGCSKPGDKKCGGCDARYCSRACQKKDWKTHKKVCQKKKSTGASREVMSIDHIFNIITLMMMQLLSSPRIPNNVKKVLRFMLTIDPAQHSLPGGAYDFSKSLISLEEYRYFVGCEWCPQGMQADTSAKFEKILGKLGIWHLPSEKTRQFIHQCNSLLGGSMIEVASGRSLLSHVCQQGGLDVIPFTPFEDSQWNRTRRKRLTKTSDKTIEQMLEEPSMENVSTILCAFPTPPIAEKLLMLLQKMTAKMICIFGWLPTETGKEDDTSSVPCFSFSFIADCLKCGYGVYPMHLGCISSRDTAEYSLPQTHCICIVKDDVPQELSQFLYQKTVDSIQKNDPILCAYIGEQAFFTDDYLKGERHPNDKHFSTLSFFAKLRLIQIHGEFTKSE
jgi:hypothetical protein